MSRQKEGGEQKFGRDETKITFPKVKSKQRRENLRGCRCCRIDGQCR
jgi:hypothetical protein